MATWIVSGGGDALQTSINAAVNNDTLLIDDEVYNGVVINKTLNLSSIHGFSNCIIDGHGQKRCITVTNNSYVRLYGLTLKNGHMISGDGQSLTAEGGGAANRLFSMVDCHVLSCTAASRDGGGVRLYSNNNTVISGCYFENCYADRHGGAICGSGKIYNSYFKDCNSGGWGGAVMDIRGVYDCIFDHCGTGSTYVLHANNAAGSLAKNCIFKNCYATSNTANKALIADYKAVNCIAYGTQYGCFIHMSGDAYNCTCVNNSFSSNRAINITRTAGYQTAASSGIGTMIVNNCFDGAAVYISGTKDNPIHVCNNLIGTSFTKTSTVSALISADNIIGTDATGFKDKENNDVHLDAGSNLIGAGNNEYSLTNSDFEGKLWKDPPAAGAYEYYSPTQNLPNRTYPLGREREHSGMIYDAELTYLSGPGYANFQLPMSVYDYRTSFEIKSSCGYSSSYPNRWGFDVTQSKLRYAIGLWNNGWDNIYLGGYESIGGKTSYKTNEVYTYSFDADNLSGKIILSNGTVNTFTTSLRSGYSATWSASNVNYSFFGMSSAYWRNPSIFYYAKFWNPDGMIADVIPVRVGNAGYLFDKVKGRMLTKYPIGTNIQFRKGPDK